VVEWHALVDRVADTEAVVERDCVTLVVKDGEGLEQ